MKKYTIITILVVLMVSVGVSFMTPQYQVSLRHMTLEDQRLKIFQAWSPVENMDHLSDLEQIAIHDLYFDSPWGMKLTWDISEDQPYEGLSSQLSLTNIDEAFERRRQLRKLNPNIKILSEVQYREGQYVDQPDQASTFWQQGFLPKDCDYWLLDDQGKKIPGYAEDENGDGIYQLDEVKTMLVDFTNPSFQQLVISRVVSLKDSGVYDGVYLDWWKEDQTTSSSFIDWGKSYLSLEEEKQARLFILKSIRQAVGDDFLILVNSNVSKVPESAQYINGIFMEAWKSDPFDSYSLETLKTIESTLKWASDAVKEPRINCLEGISILDNLIKDESERITYRNSESNLREMKLLTTIAQVNSNGYFNFVDDGRLASDDHLHNWYKFWNVDLGNPVAKKGHLYKGIDGLCIREFDHAYVVYNISDKPQDIQFNEEVYAITSKETCLNHSLDSRNGEIYFKKDN